jgi:hypothetical protein
LNSKDASVDDAEFVNAFIKGFSNKQARDCAMADV